MSVPIIRDHTLPDDPELRRALDWFAGLMGPAVWMKRREGVIRRYSRSLKTWELPKGSFPIQLRDTEDVIGWYMFLCESLLDHPLDYEFAQGSRVVPIFKALGRDLDLLQEVKGHEERARRLITSERKNPDSAIFELLVAAAYVRNGWTKVAFVPETPHGKTHELDVAKGRRKISVECKRMAKSSRYSMEERDHFQRLWQPLLRDLVDRRVGMNFDVIFHTELRLLPDDLLLRVARDRARLIAFPTVIHDDAQVTVTAWPCDLSEMQDVLRRQFVKICSSRFMELATGRYERHKGFVWAGAVKPWRENPSYAEEVGFLVCAKWDCDAPDAIARKARHILDHVAKAVQQLPKRGPCVVHVGIEAMDGDLVEQKRRDRIQQILAGFHPVGRKLDWIYVNVFVPEHTPECSWAIDETVYKFNYSRYGRIPEPLSNPNLVLPDSVLLEHRAHWERPLTQPASGAK